MNILNDVVLDFSVDTKVLDATPAKLKLREKTLKGLRSNIEDENTIPGMMLAKKKKNKKQKEEEEKTEEPVVNVKIDLEEELKNITATIIETLVNATGESKKLRLSQEKEEALRKNALEIEIPDVVIEPQKETELETSVENVPNVEEAQEDGKVTDAEVELPEIQDIRIDEIPVEEKEIDTYNVEQGEVGEVAEVSTITEDNVENSEEAILPNIVDAESKSTEIENAPEIEIIPQVVEEEKKIPTLDEIREKMIPTVENVEVKSETALDKASEDDMFKEATSLRNEVNGLKEEHKKAKDELSTVKSSYDYALDLSVSLDKTFAERQKAADEAEKEFYEALKNQKEILTEMKKSLKEETEANKKEAKELGAKTSELEKGNSEKQDGINSATEKLLKYKELLSSLQSLGEEAEKVNEETSYNVK